MKNLRKNWWNHLNFQRVKISKLSAALKKGDISLSDLVNNGNSGNSGMDGNNKGIDGKGTKNSKRI